MYIYIYTCITQYYITFIYTLAVCSPAICCYPKNHMGKETSGGGLRPALYFRYLEGRSQEARAGEGALWKQRP